MEEWEEESHLFVLRMMNFIFKAKSVIFPEDLHKLLEKYPVDRLSRFTPKITQAALILMEQEDEKRNSIVIDFLLPHSAEMYEICNHFNCKDFMIFCVHCGVQSVRDYLRGNMKAPEIVFKTLFRALVVCREAGSFNDETWKELDDYAEQVIRNAYGKSTLETSIESSTETEEERVKNVLIANSEFILRVMNHVFLLHFKRLPPELDSMLRLFSENPHPHFSPTVQHAIMAELNTQANTLRLVDVNDLENYYETKVMEDFKAKVFLEACVCLSKKAMREYFEEAKVNSPLRIHGLLSMRIGYARCKNQFNDWVEMEQAAIELITIDEQRRKHENQQLLIASLGEEALESFAPFESSSGIQRPRRTNRNELSCPGCKCH